MPIYIHYLKSDSTEVGTPAAEYTISVSRGDGLPMTPEEVDAALSSYMLSKLRVEAADARTEHFDGSSVLSKQPCSQNKSFVTFTHDSVFEILAKLPPRANLAWVAAMKQLRPTDGPQVVTIRDSASANQLVKAGLLKPYVGSEGAANLYILPSSLAYCGVEPVESGLDEVDDAFLMAPLRSDNLDNMGWLDVLDEVEMRLGDLIPHDHANHLATVADSHHPWYDEARSGRRFNSDDVDSIVAWLMERRNLPDFQPRP